MKKILLLTDSLGLPRVMPELINDEWCWTYRLADHYSSVFRFRVVSVPGMDTNQLMSLVTDYYQTIQADLVIIQVGIVDCYPRAIKKAELSLLLRMPGFLNRFIHRWVKRNYSWLIAKRGIRYVQPAQFSANLHRLRQSFPNSKVLVVPIAPPTKAYVEKNPLIRGAVTDYNNLLATNFPSGYLADCYAEATDDIFLSDNHHLSGLGNELVYRAVREALSLEDADSGTWKLI